MFDDPFCQFLTFSIDILEGLLKQFSLSAEDRFERKNFFNQRGVSFMNFGVRAKEFYIFGKKTGKIAKFMID